MTAQQPPPVPEPEERNESPVSANDTARADDPQSMERPLIPVSTVSESRDVSTCSRNRRDSLRRNMSLRSHTLTESERLFLEQLADEGSDHDVERALKIVTDEDLFFEETFPPITQPNIDDAIGLDINESSSSGPADDATRDAEAASVATSERRNLDRMSSLTISSNDARSSNASSKPPIPSTILGSKKRREVLERRRSDTSLNMATLWRAHETGLAVTNMGSRRSLHRRESSMSSIASSVSGLSILFGNRPHPGASREDVFRSEMSTPTRESSGRIGTGIKTPTPTKGKPPRQFRPSTNFPPMVRRSPHRRSKSATLFSPVKSLPKISEGASRKPTHARAKSFGKRRSVTFHQIDEELEFDKELESSTITPKSSQKVRRTTSDSQIALPVEEQLQGQPTRGKKSTGTISNLLHQPHLRQDSISSIPSLHHGNAVNDSMSLMGQSTSSIPSLHHGNPIRDSMSIAGRSTSSIPSLHHGNPIMDSKSIAGMSTSSIPSLHHGNPIRDSMSVARQSTSSIPSLHQAHPIRQESTGSFPSLHPARPIRYESMSSVPSIHHARELSQITMDSSIPPNALTQDEMIQQFGVTEDVASAWLQLASSNRTLDMTDRRSSLVSLLSLPSVPGDVDIPDAATTPDIPTALDAERNLEAATAPTVTTTLDDGEEVMPNQDALSDLLGSTQKPVFLRQASRNIYEGEGIEVTEFDDRPMDGILSDTDSFYYNYPPDNDVFRNNISLFSNHGSIRTAGSFDDVSIFSSFGQQQRTSDVFREIRRSLSDDNLSKFVGGQNKEFFLQIPNSSATSDTFIDEISEDGGSTAWEMEYASPANSRFDAWNILQDDYVNGYGGAGTLGFKILGTSATDVSAQPHVLSPPLMESLQAFLPPTKSGENFFLKYSMIRDGASLRTLLQRARGIKYSILAVETIDGEVFGSFTGQAWRKSWNYFGTGESFLWRMRHSRLDTTNGVLDQAQKESEVEVYPYTGENEFIQLCTHDRIAVGGGIPDHSSSSEQKSQNEPISNPLVDHNYDWGLGLSLESDLLQGSSSPCLTFGSPSLSMAKPNGDRFEVVNVELWTTTPFMTEEEAEKVELGYLFLGSPTNNDQII